MKLKKTDYMIIVFLIIVIIAGVVGVVLAVNLIGENNRRDREERMNANTNADTNVTEENATEEPIVDPTADPNEQMQQLVNMLPNALQSTDNQKSITSIKIKYAYGYDVSLAEEMKFVDVLEIDCKDEELKALAQLIENNKFSEIEKETPVSADVYYNTRVTINGNKTLDFSDKNAVYKHDDKTTYVVLNEDLLLKLSEIVNTEVKKKVSIIDTTNITSAKITNSDGGTVTIVDKNEISTICALTSSVNLNSSVVDLSNEKVVYVVELSNGTKMSVTSGGATGYFGDNSKQQQVKFMFDAEKSLESIFKKYAN